MKKVIVYGLGKNFFDMKRTIEEKYEIVGYMDTYKKEYGGKKVLSCDELDLVYDYIFILPYGAKVKIAHELRRAGVPEEKIIPYFGENRDINLGTARFVEDHIEVVTDDYNISLFTKSDESVFRTIFVKNEYNLSLCNDSVFVDIGMNIGLASIQASINERIKKIYAFEPFVSTYQSAVKNINKSPCVNGKIKTYNYGLSDYDGDVLVPYDELDSQSMTTTVTTTVSDTSTERVIIKEASRVLKDIIETNTGMDIVCKVDCEGSEYPIFRALNKENLINKINTFIIEWHVEDNDIITDILKKNNFTFIKTNFSYTMGMIYAWRNN